MARTKTALAADIWRDLFSFFIATRPQRDQALERHGLTPNDSRALYDLDPKQGRTMRSLAEAWKCDPSNATFMVDRLEQRGLAVRQSDPDDRRVKLVVLTPQGVKVKAALAAELYEPPPALLGLSHDELEALERVVAKLAAGQAGGGSSGER
jgi:DNA-binding MarR family transcriptional regulator